MPELISGMDFGKKPRTS